MREAGNRPADMHSRISSGCQPYSGCAASLGFRYEKTTRLHRVHRHAGNRSLLLHRNIPISAKAIDLDMSSSPMPPGWTEPLSYPMLVGDSAKPPPLVRPMT